MATVTTNFNPRVDIVPLQGPSTLNVAGSAIPQHVVRMSIRQDWPASGGSNNSLLVFNGYLPRNYAYILTDFSVALWADVAADVNNFGSVSGLSIQDFPSQDSSGITEYIACNSWGQVTRGDSSLVPGYGRIYMPERLPLYPIRQHWTDPTYVNIGWSAWNGVAVDGGGTAEFYARLLAYDLQQVENWPVNSPQIST